VCAEHSHYTAREEDIINAHACSAHTSRERERESSDAAARTTKGGGWARGVAFISGHKIDRAAHLQLQVKRKPP
jgi:hypothetical protein